MYYKIFKIYYYINNIGNKKIYEEERCYDFTIDIEYKDCEELDGITIEKLESKRREKQYPIRFKKYYYKKEINTQEKNKKLDKVEDIIIYINHFSRTVKKDGFDYLEEYDQEVFVINGKTQNKENSPKFNYTSKKLKKFLREEDEIEKRDEISKKWKLFSPNEHTFEFYKRKKIYYDDGSTDITPWSFYKYETLYYD